MRKIFLSILLVIMLTVFTNNYEITTNSKHYKEGNVKVSQRELALASALSYMPIPAKCKLIKNNVNSNCYFSDREIVIDKFNQFVNLHNYATTKELNNWQIVDYTEEKTNDKSTSFDRIFNAYTLKNGNNVIILFRGTDFSDLLEWIQHLSYASTNVHAQEAFAEKYVLKQALKYKDCNIYITGHSLGGYLTQVAASTLQKAINNGKNGSTSWEGWNIKEKYNIKNYLDKNATFNEYKDINFVQAVSFNGMGMLFYVKDSDETSIQKEKIKVLKNIGKNEFGESKLINYTIKGDVVSSLGLLFGEIRQMDAALDSVTYHRKNYKFLKPLNNLVAKSVNLKDNNSTLFKYSNDLNNNLSLSNHILRNDLIETYKYYDMKSIVAYLNLTHESDEFACILNGNENPRVNIYEEKQWLLSTQANYIVKKQNNVIATKENTPINIRAMTTGACARRYVWYECTDQTGSVCNEIQTNELGTDNDSSLLNTNFTNGIKYYKVKAIYNDSYKKGHILSSKNKYKYIFENNSENLQGEVTSNVIAVISDSQKPNCKLDTTSFENKQGCNKQIKLTCSDNISMQLDKVTSFSGSLLNNISIKTDDKKRNTLVNKLSTNINIKSNLFNSSNERLKITVKDYVGNKTDLYVNGRIKLFGGKCN